MDYVHCYSCYVQLKQETEHLFYISSCGKLYCSTKCLENVKSKKCDSCQKCEVILLTQAPPQVQEFFSDVGTVMEDMQLKCKKIIDYQNGLRDRMFKCICKKYSNLKAEYIKLSEHYNTLNKDYKRLQDHIKRDTAAHQRHYSPSVPNSAGSENQLKFGNKPQPSRTIYRNQPQSHSSSVLFSGGSSVPRNFHEIRNNPLNVSNLSSSIGMTPSNMSVNSYGGSTIRGNNSCVGSVNSEQFLTLSKLSLNKYRKT